MIYPKSTKHDSSYEKGRVNSKDGMKALSKGISIRWVNSTEHPIIIHRLNTQEYLLSCSSLKKLENSAQTGETFRQKISEGWPLWLAWTQKQGTCSLKQTHKPGISLLTVYRVLSCLLSPFSTYKMMLIKWKNNLLYLKLVLLCQSGEPSEIPSKLKNSMKIMSHISSFVLNI